MPDIPAPEGDASSILSDADPITFFGHYAVMGAVPEPLRPNLACLDYGLGKGGQLAAYSLDGEKRLRPDKFTVVPENGRPNSHATAEVSR